MALLLGCDFCPGGISGLGKETVRQLLYVWPLRYVHFLIGNAQT